MKTSLLGEMEEKILFMSRFVGRHACVAEPDLHGDRDSCCDKRRDEGCLR